MAKIDTFVSKRDPSDEEIEEGAKDCESFCNISPPPSFSNKNLTPNMFILSFVLPKQIRTLRMANEMLRIEQEGEHLHQVFNTLERKYKNVALRERRFWYILQEYENKYTEREEKEEMFAKEKGGLIY